MSDHLQEAKKKLESGFFWFWLKQWRTTLLVLLLIILMGSFSAIQIPKESTPEINLGMVTITTVYPGGTPEDINHLITEKIEKQIETLDGVSKITATSVDSISSLIVTLDNNADTERLSSKIENEIKKVNLPSDANDPIITQINSKMIGKSMFSLLLYAKDKRFDLEYLKRKAQSLKSELEGQWGTDTIEITDGENYEIQVLVNQIKLEQLGLSLARLSQILQGFNSNQPLGTHKLGEKEYAFRIDGELKTLEEIKQLPIPLNNGKTISLENLASVKIHYEDKNLIRIGHQQGKEKSSGNLAVNLTFNKKSWSSILSASKKAKAAIAQELSKAEYEDLGYFFTNDIGELISESYTDLAINMISTLLIVFLIVFLFVGGLESFLATISIPLAFFVTFFVLNSLWRTMNTLTNFSLIICLGIAVDTATVIIQGASEYIKAGYKPIHAALLSVKTYKNSLISGTATTVVVFIPLMSLPGIMGSFLAYIPITIFITLLASLFISLTITPALFFQIKKEPRFYESNTEKESFLSKNEKLILEEDRIGKSESTTKKKKCFRDTILDKVVEKYDNRVSKGLASAKSRAFWVLAPMIILIFTAIFIAPRLGFIMMPPSDNEYLNITITAPIGLQKELIASKAEGIHTIFHALPELTNYSATIKGNELSVILRILPKEKRKRSSFDIEAELTKQLAYLEQKGFQVSVAVRVNGPSQGGGEVWIKLLAKAWSNQESLRKVAKDFEEYLSQLPWTKNISNSSKESPGQFVFELDNDKLAMLGLTQSAIGPELYLALNGMKAGSIKIDDNTHDIKLKYADFDESVSPEALMSTLLNTPAGQISLGSIGNYIFKPAVSSISREKWEITVTIGASLLQHQKAEPINESLYKYAENYPFPEGISYAKGGEQEENADLIFALFSAFVFAFIVIFAILVLQFNSYTQPLIISYSILMGFVGATRGTLIMGYPYSMMFMIGFVALMGIVVNNAIILIDAANENRSHGQARAQAIKESAKWRIKPILSTTLTTVIGLSTLISDGMFAPLAYTIMFGLSISTFMTLFSVPALYQDEHKVRILIKRVFLKPLIMILTPLLMIWILYLLSVMFKLDLLANLYGKSAIIALFLSIAVFLIVWEFYRNSQGEAGRRQSILKLNIIAADGVSFSKKQILKRIVIKFGLLLAPILMGLLLSGIFKLLGGNPEISAMANWLSITLAGILYLSANLYCFWTSEHNQFLHDKLSGISIVDEEKEHD